MMINTTSKIMGEHTDRLAYVYVRQSTMGQVRLNQESTQRQYALKERALTLGWPAPRVMVLDRDLGESGAQMTKRGDFQRLIAEVSLGRVGAVLALEASRLSRSCADWHRLLELCALTCTPIIDEDGCYDPRDFNDQLLLGVKGTMHTMWTTKNPSSKSRHCSGNSTMDTSSSRAACEIGRNT